MPPYLLVVESDPELQRRIGDTLREASYELATETEGAWAKRTLLVRPPDGVILDTHLSDGSGFSVAEELRRDPDTQKVPIFFVASRYRGAAHQSEARRRFAPAEYLPTPLDLDSLLAVVLETVPPSDPRQVTPVPDYPAYAPSQLADRAQRRERRAVEQAARELMDGEDPDLRGSLRDEPFARVLQRIYAQRRSGALLLQREGAKKIVYFQDGYPVSIRSNLLGECLGQILLSHKMISRETLEQSLRRMKAENRQQGKVLIEMGALSPWSLQRALVAQMEAKFFEIFAWRAGEFAFKDGRDAPDEPVRLEKPTAALILEGIRRHYDQDRVRAVLAPYSGRYVSPSRDPRQRLQDITADAAEQRFVASLDGSTRLEAVLSSAPIPLQKARLLLVAMSEAGMIEAADAPTRREETRRQAAPAPGVPRGGDAPGREQLAATLEALRTQSYFEVLGVDPGASPAEVDAAYEALAREYHPDRFRFRPEEIRQLALKIFDRLGEAQATLRDPARRRKYVQQRERGRGGRDEAAVLPAAGRQSPPAAAEQIYFNGVEHLRARRYTEAVQAFRQATALAPGQASYRGALGWAVFRQAPADPQAVTDALGELRRAVEMEPMNPWVRISLARFHAETGRPDEAIAEFETAQRLKPDLPEVEEEIRRLRGNT